jgi:hypothetical protein
VTFPSTFGTQPFGVAPPYVAPAAQPGNALFLSSRRIDGATLTASSAESTLPVTLLQNPDPAAKWRATGCTAESVTIDLGLIAECDTLELIGHNLSADGKIRARTGLASGDTTTNPLRDTGWQSPWPASGMPFEEGGWPSFLSLLRWSSVLCRYIRLDIADPSNPAGYVEAARVFVGKGFQLMYDVDQNLGLSLDSPDQQSRSEYGKTFIDPRGNAPRRFTLPITAVNDGDLKRSLFELQRYSGLGRDFGFVLDPGATTDFHIYSLQAVFAGTAQFTAQPMWDSSGQVWQTSLTLTEML